MIHVTQNAIDRYIELIEPVSREVARSRIASAERGVEAAARFGAFVVKTATAKLIIQGHRVVTVLPKNWIDHAGMTNAERAAVYAENAAAWTGPDARIQ